MNEANRRDFLRMLGIGSAAGLAGCSKTAPDALTPYVVPPEELVRGHPLWFRSTCRECPAGCGIAARVREGRVHKVEGNPLHPVNGGGLCARGQAAVQGLYSPDRLRSPLARAKDGKLRAVAWPEAQKTLVAGLSTSPSITVITGAETGAAAELLRRIGNHIQIEPVAYDALREANRLSFGIAGLPVLRFAEARAILLLGADVLETFVSPVGYARGISEARRTGARMVYVGSRLSLTGAHADRWIAVPPAGEGLVAMALLREVLARRGGNLAADDRARLRAWSEPFTSQRAGVPAETIAQLARELAEKPSIAVAGGTASCDENGLFTAVAVNLLNYATGAINQTVRFGRASALDRAATRAELAAWPGPDGAVIVAGANPAYAIRGFADKLRKAPFVAVLASWPDETCELAHLVLPVHTPLESWGDSEPWSGIHSLQQPAMIPVFNTRDAGDLFIEIANALGRGKIAEPNYREFLRGRWRRLHQDAAGKEDFEAFWAASLERGGYWRDVSERKVSLQLKALPEYSQPERAPYRLQTYPSLAHFDGRGANKSWLQELPDPITQVVWDTWLEVNPRDAERLGVRTGDRVRVRSKHGEAEVAAYLYPGIQPGAVAMPLGQGHTAYGRYATGVGVNAAALLDPAGARWSGEPVEISLLRKAQDLVTIPKHNLQEHREIARSRIAGAPAPRPKRHDISMYPPQEYKQHHWAMAIDLNACTACSACVTACYAENNIPVVGKEEVGRGRHMSWIRVERFFGPGSAVSQPFQIDFTLMLCQQCDKAPCEPVCPVFASVHNVEGLNAQVYNRCVGTRYCSNNCPYKARRFNWYQGEFPAPLEWQLNPDVTVRSKGVMEKCTFCVQRIVAGKDRARRERRALADGEIVPACAQSCPTGAIVFGDLNDKQSRVAHLARDPRGYTVFEELNTRPAVTYLERERRI